MAFELAEMVVYASVTYGSLARLYTEAVDTACDVVCARADEGTPALVCMSLAVAVCTNDGEGDNTDTT